MKSGLAFRTAEKHVRNYQQETQHLMAEHREAMDCRECETFLQIGIDAFHWLIRADRELRIGVANGVPEAYTQDVASAFEALCKAWLGPCEYAQQWIGKQIERGYTVDNQSQFMECCDEMGAIVKFNESGENESGKFDGLPVTIAHLRDQAINEFDNGQTAEFV